MKKSMRILALLLALLMLCGCQKPDGTQPPASTAPTGPADYTVKVVDPLGRGMEGVGVKFIRNGVQEGMAISDASGLAVKNLERGAYTLVLSFMDEENSYYYDMDALKLSATETSTEIVVAYEMGNQTETLTVSGRKQVVYNLQFADSKLTITGASDTSLNGTYAFTTNQNGLQVEGADVEITANLLHVFTFRASGFNGALSIVNADGDELNVEKDENGMVIAPEGEYFVVTSEAVAYYVNMGCTYVKLNETGKNYFIFTPTQAGIYEFKVMGEGTIGDHGTPNYAVNNSDVEVVDGAFTKTITQDMIGNNGTGTTQMVLGIDTKNAGVNTYLCISRVGDAPAAVEWEEYLPTYTPSKFNLPAGSVLTDLDLSKSYTLVFNEEDQFYHLNSADGPVVLVRLLSANEHSGFAFGNILLGSNVASYHYDENDVLVRKVSYNACLEKYLGKISGMGENRKFSGGMCDDQEGVYPLTKDLETILKNYGEYMGYWDSTNPNYLFAAVMNLNVESAWLFACCYAQ